MAPLDPKPVCAICSVGGQISPESLSDKPLTLWQEYYYCDSHLPEIDKFNCSSAETTIKLSTPEDDITKIAEPETTRMLHIHETDLFTHQNSLLTNYDAAVLTITQRRGQDYSTPIADFSRMSKFAEIIAACPDPEIRHALYMICVKISRLVATPNHLDSIIDIAGYARTIAMVLNEREAQKTKNSDA